MFPIQSQPSTIATGEVSNLDAAAVAAANNISQIVNETIEIEEHKLKLMFVRLYQTFLVWVGDPLAPSLDNISLALGTSMTTMFAKNPDLVSDAQMASKLSTGFNGGRPVYVAYNYPPMANNGALKLEVDRRLWKFVAKCLEQDGGGKV